MVGWGKRIYSKASRHNGDVAFWLDGVSAMSEERNGERFWYFLMLKGRRCVKSDVDLEMSTHVGR